MGTPSPSVMVKPTLCWEWAIPLYLCVFFLKTAVGQPIESECHIYLFTAHLSQQGQYPGSHRGVRIVEEAADAGQPHVRA